MAAYKHMDLRLPNPAYDSPLVDVVNELEHLRRLRLRGTTPAPLFFQLKDIFHTLESLGSARIEGNHTTLADYVEAKLDNQPVASDQFREMQNIEQAMAYIEASLKPGEDIREHFIRELHSLTVDMLEREGDRTPGAYRTGTVRIAQSEHAPPEAVLVPQYMEELVHFINQHDKPKYDLIKVALAHHRFGWVHPFGNGNGRVVRLLTYAMLIKYGFNVRAGGRLLNPTAVFCANREHYYSMLALADTGTDENLEAWCIYVLQGILEELQKVDRLTDYDYLQRMILQPALQQARGRKLITDEELRILQATVRGGVVKSGDLASEMPGMNSGQRTYQIKKLVDNKMLKPVTEGARQYTIGFSSSYLIRGVIQALKEEGFIPAAVSAPPQ